MENKLKTYAEWEELIPKEFELIILDPDGWDRTNWNFSFYEEQISIHEFIKRLGFCTISCKNITKLFSNDWLKENAK